MFPASHAEARRETLTVMKFLKNPLVQTALVALLVVIVFPRIRPWLQKIPGIGAWL